MIPIALLRIRHILANDNIVPVKAVAPPIYQMEDGTWSIKGDTYSLKFPKSYQDYWETYVPTVFYENWRESSRKEEAPVPHVDFANLDENDIEGMVEFCSTWGSHKNILGEAGISIKEFRTKLKKFKKMVQLKINIEAGDCSLNEAISFASNIDSQVNQRKLHTDVYSVNDGTFEFRPLYLSPSIYVEMVWMLQQDFVSGFRTRECDHCHRFFSAKRTDTRHCSNECRERKKSAKYHNKFKHVISIRRKVKREAGRNNT